MYLIKQRRFSAKNSEKNTQPNITCLQYIQYTIRTLFCVGSYTAANDGVEKKLLA